MSAILPISRADSPPHAARLFALLWGGLTDVLGSATTATLLRRSVQAVAATSTNVERVQIRRVGLEYSYELPPEWRHDSPESMEALRTLVGELKAILTGLTGEVVLHALDRIDGFAAAGIHFVDGDR